MEHPLFRSIDECNSQNPIPLNPLWELHLNYSTYSFNHCVISIQMPNDCVV